MSSSPTPAPETPQQDPEIGRKLVEAVLQVMPRWVRVQSRATFSVSLTAFRLILYMFLHWLVGRVFADYVAADVPMARRYLEVLSVGVFGFLIGKSLLELVWEEMPRRKKTPKIKG